MRDLAAMPAVGGGGARGSGGGGRGVPEAICGGNGNSPEGQHLQLPAPLQTNKMRP